MNNDPIAPTPEPAPEPAAEPAPAPEAPAAEPAPEAPAAEPAPAPAPAEPQPVVGNPFASNGAAPAGGTGKKAPVGLIVGISVGVVAVIALVIVLILVLANGGKTLSCESSHEYGSYTQKAKIEFKFNDKDEVTGAHMKVNFISAEKISDEEYKQLEDAQKNASSDYSSTNVSRSGDKEVIIEAEVKASAVENNFGKKYDDIKKYMTETGGYTCKE